MAKKIYTEQTEYGQRIVIDYGTHKTVVDVEDGDKSGMGDDRVYVAHEAQNGNMTDIVRITKDKDDNFSISCDLMTREQINITPKTANKFPCVAKCKWGYLTDSTDLGNTWCKDISKAHIFNSQDEIDAVKLRGNGKISFVSANKKTIEKPYVLLVTDGIRKGLYIKKRSSRSIFFSSYKDGAMRFSSEKQAEAYKEKIDCASILGMKVVRIEE